MHYIDTSVLVAGLTNEKRTVEVQEWLAAQPAEEMQISDWVITEFSGALSLKVRTQQLNQAQRADVLTAFNALVDESMPVLAVSRLEFRAAAHFADQHTTGLRSGDALHLAVAANHGLCVLSLDNTLVAAAETLGVSATLF